jgi:HAMP domain-containing protein
VGWLGKTDPKEMKDKAQIVAKSINVVNLLMPKQKVLSDLANQLEGEFPDELRKHWGVQPAFLGVLDENGVMLLRGDRSRLHVGSRFAKDSLALQTTLAQHQATSELWLKQKVADVASAEAGGGEIRPELLRMGFAPIGLPQGKLAGVLVLGWEVGDVRATQLRKSTGTQVAFLFKDAIAAITLKKAKASAFSKAEVASVNSQDWTAPKTSRISVDGEPFVAVAGVFPETGSTGYTFVLFASLDKARARYDHARWTIVLLGLLLALLFLIVNLVMRRHFILPISELEKGVAELVAGNLEYQFGVPSDETEGLAFSLNDLLAQFLGRPAPGEEEDEEGGEGGGQPAGRVVFSLGPLPERAYGRGDSGMLPRLDEAKDVYYKRIFEDYLKAMKESGADIANITLQAFQAKLEVNERLICTRLKCSEVRFTVQTSEEGIILQPFPIS